MFVYFNNDGCSPAQIGSEVNDTPDHGIQGSTPPDSSEHARMKAEVRKVKLQIDAGWKKTGGLAELPETLGESCKVYIEQGSYEDHISPPLRRIPETPNENRIGTRILEEEGFALVQLEELARETVEKPGFKNAHEGMLYQAVCYQEAAALEALRTQEEVLNGMTTEESDHDRRSSAGSEHPAAQEQQDTNQVPLPEPDPTKFGSTPSLISVLLCVYAFLGLAKFETIFQRFDRNRDGHLHNNVGDGRRLQAKMGQLPKLEESEYKTRPLLLNRLRAGKRFLEDFLQSVSSKICGWLPNDYVIYRAWDEMYAGPVKALAQAAAQFFHTDKEPDRHGKGAAVLINISLWSCWVSCLLKSSKNIEALLKYYRSNYDLFKKLYIAEAKLSVRGKSVGQINELLHLPWQCHLENYVQDNPSTFKKMMFANIELTPWLMKIFKLDQIHGGGEYPGKVPHRLRKYSQLGSGNRQWHYRYGKVHYRSVTPVAHGG